MISDSTIRRALRFARPVVAERFDPTTAQAVLERMEGTYAALIPELPPLRSRFNRMTLRIAVDALALYRALLTELPRDEALAAIEPFVTNWMEGQFENPIVRWIFRTRPLHLRLRRRWFAEANRADDPGGQRFEFVPPEGELFYGVDVTRCGLVRFLTRMGAPELAPLMCRGDHVVEAYLPPGIEFRRTRLIAEGADRCDFRYHERDRGRA